VTLKLEGDLVFNVVSESIFQSYVNTKTSQLVFMDLQTFHPVDPNPWILLFNISAIT
jgi:hypothetical protein